MPTITKCGLTKHKELGCPIAHALCNESDIDRQRAEGLPAAGRSFRQLCSSATCTAVESSADAGDGFAYTLVLTPLKRRQHLGHT